MSNGNNPDGGTNTSSPDGGAPAAPTDGGASTGGTDTGSSSSGTDAGTSSGSTVAGASSGGTDAAAATGTTDTGAQTGDPLITPVDSARGDNTTTMAPTAANPWVTSMTVSCGHGGRQVAASSQNPGSPGRLQIVPNTGQTVLQTGLTIQTYIQLQVQASSGGTDTIQATNNANGPVPQLAITQGDSPADGDWTGSLASQTISSPGDSSVVWLDGAQPTVYNVFARGDISDNAPIQIRVEAFPAYSVQGTVNLNVFNDLANLINQKLKDTIQPLTGGEVSVEPQILLPAGNLQVSSGWKENTDWQAYYSWEVIAGIEPLFGMSLTVAPNLAAIAGSLVGIPPQITNYAANIFVSLQVGGQVGISGRMAKVGPGSIQGGIRPDGQLWLQIGLGAKVGNEQIVSAQITGSCKVSVTLKADLAYQSGAGGGLILNPAVSFDGLTVTVRVVTSAGDVEVTNNELCTWTVIGPQGPWQPDKPFVLIGN
jgi:hypothetical protein